MGKSTAIGPLTGRSRLLPPSGYGGATTTTSCGDSATATATTSYNDNVTGRPYKVRLLRTLYGLPGVASPRFIFL
uniref:Uncharacterized protein n=1 Tax=Oryza barthii TaxID=65489 RepID=A0A0D3HM70_9ORYZ